MEREYGLGRVHKEDERDENYLMASLVEAAPPERQYRYWWTSGWWGNQGLTSLCVAYAWVHWLEDGPVTQAPFARGEGPIFDPGEIYRRAQQLDQIPGENYQGTTVRGGAKALQERGAIGSYYWAWDIETVVNAILTAGPVVVGTPWYESMFRPDEDGMLHISGSVAGGHAYVLNGVSRVRGVFRIKNSWGTAWGKDGRAYIAIEDMERLLSERGEACIATEKQVGG